MMDKERYLKAVEEAYHTQGRVTTTVGLYLTAPFAGSDEGAKLAQQARQLSLDLEEKLRELYRVENEVRRP